MAKAKSYSVYRTVVFCLICCCLELLVVLIYPDGMGFRHAAYGLVLCCLYYALCNHNKGAEAYMGVLALFFTAGADFFLVHQAPANELMGVGIFVIAQLCWCIRLLIWESGKKRLYHLITWGLLFGLLALLSILLTRGTTLLNILATGYFSLLLSTVIFSWASPYKLLFTIGMTLFLACDCFIAAREVAPYLTPGAFRLIEGMNAIPWNMPWVFYGPSQVLLALSCKES